MAQPKANANVHLLDQRLKQIKPGVYQLKIKKTLRFIVLLYKVCDEECVGHTRGSLHVHQDVEEHLKSE